MSESVQSGSSFSQARCPSCHTTIGVKALKGNQSTEEKIRVTTTVTRVRTITAMFNRGNYDMSVDCSHLHGKLVNSCGRSWLAKKCALQLSTRLLGVAKSLAVFTWVKVCIFMFFY